MKRADEIYFEAEAVQTWLAQLERRIASIVKTAKTNPVFKAEWRDEYAELLKVHKALLRIQPSLSVFTKAVSKREAEV